MSTETTVKTDAEKFLATASGKFLVLLVTTFVSAGVAQVLKNPSVAQFLASGGSFGAFALFVRDVLNPTVKN